MKDYSKYEINDFVADSGFINWILSPDSESDNFWNSFLNANPHQLPNIEEAKKVIYALDAAKPIVLGNRLDYVWDKIDTRTTNTHKFNSLVFGRWAAIAILLISIGIVTFNKFYTPGFQFAEQAKINTEGAKLILADGSTKSLIKEDSEIEVSTEGEIILNSDTIKSSSVEEKGEALNHVIIPYGKQSSLHLPDGTLVYVNAGTKFSFPS